MKGYVKKKIKKLKVIDASVWASETPVFCYSSNGIPWVLVKLR